MAKAFRQAVTGRCQACNGNGQAARYTQAAEVLRGGKVVAVTDMTLFGSCKNCGGSGKARP